MTSVIDKARKMLRLAESTNGHEAEAFRDGAYSLLESVGVDGPSFEWREPLVDLTEAKDRHQWQFALASAVAVMSGARIELDGDRIRLAGDHAMLIGATADFAYYADHVRFIERYMGPGVAFGFAMGLFLQANHFRGRQSESETPAGNDPDDLVHDVASVEQGVKMAMEIECYTPWPKLTGELSEDAK